jgi:hypothetical protein
VEVGSLHRRTDKTILDVIAQVDLTRFCPCHPLHGQNFDAVFSTGLTPGTVISDPSTEERSGLVK